MNTNQTSENTIIKEFDNKQSNGSISQIDTILKENINRRDESNSKSRTTLKENTKQCDKSTSQIKSNEEIMCERLQSFFIKKQKSNGKLIPMNVLISARKEFNEVLTNKRQRISNISEKATMNIGPLPYRIGSYFGLTGKIIGGMISGITYVGGFAASVGLMCSTGLMNQIIEKRNVDDQTYEYEKYKNIYFSGMNEFKDFFPFWFNATVYEDTITGKLSHEEINEISAMKFPKKQCPDFHFKVKAKFKGFEIIHFKSILINGIEMNSNKYVANNNYIS